MSSPFTQRVRRTFIAASLSVATIVGASSSASAMDLVITIENLSPTNGFFLTPTWVGLHNGSFDLFDVGTAATPGLELIAEQGDVSVLQSEFAAPGRLQGLITGPAGFGSMAGQPPLIDTGETASTAITPINPAAYRYFSYASMVIPSNDAFIGNGNPTAYEIYDMAGNFNGTQVIDIFGADIWDSGTEVNDTMGAAFSAVGGTGTDEGGTVQMHPGLANFEGTGTPVGPIGAGLAPAAGTLVARITITQVPEPTTAMLAIVGLVGLGATRRKRA